MKIDLSGLSHKELEKLRTDVDKALERLEVQRLAEARKAAETAAKKFGYGLKDLIGAPKAAKAKPSAPKYRNPSDPSKTWTGRGRQPGWIKEALKAGKSLDDMAI